MWGCAGLSLEPSRYLTPSGAWSAVAPSCGSINCSGPSLAALTDLRRARLRLFTLQRGWNAIQVTNGLEHPGGRIRLIPM